VKSAAVELKQLGTGRLWRAAGIILRLMRVKSEVVEAEMEQLELGLLSWAARRMLQLKKGMAW
jgi:hypothetical protein